MKPLFEVLVRGGDERAAEVLRAAGLSVGGPPYNQSGDVIVAYVFVVIRERSAEAARERVEAKLPTDGTYVVELVSRLDEGG